MLLFGGGSASASVPAQLISPASSSVQGGGLIHVSYTLPQAPDSGSVHLTFTPTVGAVSLQYGFISTATSDDFTFSVSNPALSPKIYSGSFAIPDNTYTVILSYTVGGGAEQTVTNTLVKVKNSTLAPNLILPANDSHVNALDVSYSLPEALLPGSTILRFDDYDTSQTKCTLHLTDLGASTVRNFNLDPASPGASSFVSSVSPSCDLADRDYAVILAYQDAAGDPSSADISAPVVLDRVTQAPTLTEPATDSVNPSTIDVSYSHPEDALASSVALTFTGPSTSTIGLSPTTAGQHGLTLDPNDLAGSGTVTGDATLADGLYSVTVEYQDALGNPVATSAAATNVRVGPVPAADPPAGGNDVPPPPATQGKFCFVTSKPQHEQLKDSFGKDERGRPNRFVVLYSVTVRSSNKARLALDLNEIPKGVKTTVKVNGTKITIPPAMKGSKNRHLLTNFTSTSAEATTITATTKYGKKSKKFSTVLKTTGC
jgi:hypothetical protein